MICAVRMRQAREALAFIGSYNVGGSQWLDIGCIFGYLLDEARRKGYNVFGANLMRAPSTMRADFSAKLTFITV